MRLTPTNLKGIFLKYNESREWEINIHVIIEMSKMIKKGFMSASPNFTAFQHHGKVSRHKILYDSSQKIKERNISFKEIRKCHQEKYRVKDLK